MITKTLALVLLLGTPDGVEQWTILDHMSPEDCRATVETIPQDVILTTFASEKAGDGWMAVMSAPVEWPYRIVCVERLDA